MIERTFDRFPVRIGRNPLNDFQIDSPFVSQFHAVLELQGNALMLRDLGSKNGTSLRGSGKVASHQIVDLGPSNYEFAISSLFFQAFPAEVAAGSASVARKKGTLFLEGSMPASAVSGGGAPGMPAMVGGNPAVSGTMEKLKPMYEAYRAAWGKFYQDLCLHAGTLDPPSRAALLEQLNLQQPAVGFEPDFQRLAQVFKANLPPSAVGSAAKQDEMLALQAVKELAQQYAPGSSIEGADSIVQFLTRLQDTLDVFLKCFIPLRDGYKQFESKMEIKRNTVKQDQMYASPKKTVETAKDPKELGRVLLDPREGNTDGPRSIEGIFADLMIHQVAMLDGVMRGVKSLLKELSPREIEALAEKKKVGGSFFGKNYEALWKVYAERHSDLADEDKEAFGLIFGPQFHQAYEQMSGGGGTEQRLHTGARPAFPAPGAPGQSITPPHGQSSNVSGQYKPVAPPPGNPNAPNPFEWPPPPGPAGPPRRGGF
jgi:type VI secretion system protein ImpI